MFERLKLKLKNAWRSWTIWFNTVGIVLLSASLADPMVLSYLSDKGLVIVIILGNVLLRFKTSSDLSDK